jgi:hypothetical protein
MFELERQERTCYMLLCVLTMVGDVANLVSKRFTTLLGHTNIMNHIFYLFIRGLFNEGVSN